MQEIPSNIIFPNPQNQQDVDLYKSLSDYFFKVSQAIKELHQEGTWTPTISFGGGSTGVTYSVQSGLYVKVGSIVNVYASIVLSDKGSSTGQAKIGGLPFTVKNHASMYSTLSVSLNNVSFADYPQIYCDINTTDILLTEITNAGTATVLTNSNFANDSGVFISGSYKEE